MLLRLHCNPVFWLSISKFIFSFHSPQTQVNYGLQGMANKGVTASGAASMKVRQIHVTIPSWQLNYYSARCSSLNFTTRDTSNNHTFSDAPRAVQRQAASCAVPAAAGTAYGTAREGLTTSRIGSTGTAAAGGSRDGRTGIIDPRQSHRCSRSLRRTLGLQAGTGRPGTRSHCSRCCSCERGGRLVALCKVVSIDVGWDIVVELRFSAASLASFTHPLRLDTKAISAVEVPLLNAVFSHCR